MPDRIDETLNAIETEPWLTSTDEPSRQRALQRCQYLAGEIRKNLGRFNRKHLNEALSLNVSSDNHAQSQKLRRGVRAVMLAHFTIKNVPLGNAASLKQDLLNKPESFLSKAFLSSFPPITEVSSTERQAWAPQHFTDPSLFPKWTNIWPGGNYRFIVTCLPNDDRAFPTLEDPNGILKKWAAISASVIDQSNSIVYGYYGFVLNVPAGNVVVANSQDQDLLNHLGTPATRAPQKEAAMNQTTKSGLLSQHLADLFSVQGKLKTPTECIQQNRNGRWNEVIVLGTSPRGESIKVSALFYRVSTDRRPYIAQHSTTNPVTAQIREKVEECSDWNDLPIIYIPDPSGRLG